MRESSQIRPNQSFPPSRAARRFGLRFAFSNARPPLPPPRRGIVRNSSTSWLNHRCLGGAGALGFASPSLTKGWDLPPRARGPSCETRPRLGKNLSLARARGADSSAFLGRPCFATGYFRFAPIAHILRTIQRDGRDAVGLRSTLAAAFGGALRAVHIPKTERGSFPTKPSLPKNCTPARASLRDSLSLGGYALGFPPSAGVSPCLGHCPAFAGRGGQSPRWWWARGGDAEAL